YYRINDSTGKLHESLECDPAGGDPRPERRRGGGGLSCAPLRQGEDVPLSHLSGNDLSAVHLHAGLPPSLPARRVNDDGGGEGGRRRARLHIVCGGRSG